MSAIFRDRSDAGQALATRLTAYAHHPTALVLGLPRGGVPVAYEVARALDLPLDVYVVRKLGVPGREELAFGAIATGGVRVINEPLVSSLDITDAEIEAITSAQHQELARRELVYRGDRPPLPIYQRTVLLVDDGMATGASMFAAITALRQRQPARTVVAVPVAASATCQQVGALADEIVCAYTPNPFYAVGQWYADFDQTDDALIRTLLDRRAQEQSPTPPPPPDQPAAPISPVPLSHDTPPAGTDEDAHC